MTGWWRLWVMQDWCCHPYSHVGQRRRNFKMIQNFINEMNFHYSRISTIHGCRTNHSSLQRCLIRFSLIRSTFSSSIERVHRHGFKLKLLKLLKWDGCLNKVACSKKPTLSKKTFQKLKTWRKRNRDLSFVLSLLFFVDLPTAF